MDGIVKNGSDFPVFDQDRSPGVQGDPVKQGASQYQFF
jgi:hypothetical protein